MFQGIGELLRHALANALKHCGTSGQHDVCVQVLADVDVTLHDGLEGCVVDPAGLLSNETWLEQNLWATEALIPNSNDVAIGELVGLLLVRALTCRLHLTVEVKRNVAELLLHVTHDLTLCRGSERVTPLRENLHHVLRQVASSQVKAENCMWQGISLIDWNRVRHTIARVHHNSSGAA